LLANTTLNILSSQLKILEDRMLAHPNQTAVEDLLNREKALAQIIDSLRQGIPYTTLNQVGAAQQSVDQLHANFVDFLTSFYGSDRKA
jgi:hypothetical protein